MKLIDDEPTIAVGLLKGVVALFRDVERRSAAEPSSTGAPRVNRLCLRTWRGPDGG